MAEAECRSSEFTVRLSDEDRELLRDIRDALKVDQHDDTSFADTVTRFIEPVSGTNVDLVDDSTLTDTVRRLHELPSPPDEGDWLLRTERVEDDDDDL